jgi:diaminohydroxyphosphoribosylaminopyrimidine deaminase/5-amino-6-(5-phosphoribosylamino)uracil reductase
MPDLAITELVGRDEWDAVNRTGRPFVVHKLASTLDGRVAAADGTSRWITSPASRAEVHRLRAACDAVVVGSGTQRADDPQLAVRDLDVPTRQPLRVVVDSAARTPAIARVLDDTAPTLIAVADAAAAGHLDPERVLRVPRGPQGIDLGALLHALFDRGVRGLLLEGGPTLAGSFVGAGLVDRVIAYLAPALLGSGPAGLGDAGVTTMAGIVRLDLLHVDRVGPDLRVVARPAR